MEEYTIAHDKNVVPRHSAKLSTSCKTQPNSAQHPTNAIIVPTFEKEAVYLFQPRKQQTMRRIYTST